MSTHLVKLIVLRLFEWLLGPSRLDFLVPHRPFFLRAADPRKPPSKVLAGNAADDVPAGFEVADESKMRPLRLSLVSSGFPKRKQLQARKNKVPMPCKQRCSLGICACNAMLMDDVGVGGTHIMLQ